MSRNSKVRGIDSTEVEAMVPKLRFPGFNEPWTAAPLSESLKEHAIKNAAGRAVFSVSMEHGIVNQVELLGRSFAAADTTHYTIGRRFDVVYTKSPLKAFPFGIVKQCKNDDEVAVSPLYGVFTPSNPHVGLLIEAYFESPARSEAFLAPLCQKGAKNTVQITNGKFLSGRLPLPVDSAEQERIAEALRSVDATIAAQAKKVDALKTHKNGLMQQLFPREEETQPKLRFPEFEDDVAWENVAIGDLSPFVTSGSRGWAAFYADEGDLFIRITNMSRDSIHLDLTDSRFVRIPPGTTEGIRTQLKAHDVLISITADIGIVGYVGEGVPLPAYINQHIALVRFSEGQLCGQFVAYSLASEQSQQRFTKATDSGTKAGMNLLGVRSMRLALPSVPEQIRIASFLGNVDALITAESRKLDLLKRHKRGLMQQLFPAPESAQP